MSTPDTQEAIIAEMLGTASTGALIQPSDLADYATRLAALPKQGWRPISEAPKDGTAILACFAPCYDVNGFLPVAVRWRTYHPNAEGVAEWRDSSGVKVRRITHWMPLPPPPEGET